MNCFEVLLPGFNGGNDETDHLVRWGKADNIEQVKAAFPNAVVHPLPVDELQFQEDSIDFDLREK